MSARVSVVLADDHALVRDTLASWLRAAPGLEVVAVAKDAEEALAEAARHQPSVVLLDIDMPGLGCFEAARQIRVRCRDTRIVFLSAFFHDRYIEQALAVGASGYITKSEPPATVVQALRAVAAGTAYFSPDVEARIVFGADGLTLAKPVHSRAAGLSPREGEVLKYLARGLSKKEIAKVTHLSERTVNRHCANLMAKLDIHDRVELARFAIREGLCEP